MHVPRMEFVARMERSEIRELASLSPTAPRIALTLHVGYEFSCLRGSREELDPTYIGRRIDSGSDQATAAATARRASTPMRWARYSALP
jgi:hypothetical protein